LVLVVATDRTTIVVLCIVAFCLGSSETMFDNASQAILPYGVRRWSWPTAGFSRSRSSPETSSVRPRATFDRAFDESPPPDVPRFGADFPR